jgi:hypothetical protein
MKTSSPHLEIEALGAGVFIRDRNVESRLSDLDFHRAFTEPVVIWMMPTEYREEKMMAVLDAAQRLCEIQCFRFPNVRVPAAILTRIRMDFPKARVEGVKTK